MRMLTCLAIALFATGCNHYVTPGGPADMGTFGAAGVSEDEKRELTDRTVQEALDKKPLATFPTGLAVARVQAPGYESHSTKGHGTGRYSVVTTREPGDEERFDRLAKLPMVSGVATLGRLVLPNQLQSDLELRQAASTLHAQVILIYTLDTRFTEVDKPQLLNVLALGHLKDRDITITSQVSALLMDTRSGYIYAVAESTARRSAETSGWDKQEVVDTARLAVENEALDGLVTDLDRAWHEIIREYAPMR